MHFIYPSRRQLGQSGYQGPFAVSFPHFLHCIFPVQSIFPDILFLLFCCVVWVRVFVVLLSCLSSCYNVVYAMYLGFCSGWRGGRRKVLYMCVGL
ncbi:hypothetical protein EDC01DRAFT_640694 [Geopyxis carbonaria]|nr:hypothetical protein EDC01DRAFT_640694 [Geopyxis carbonaria]